MHLAWALTIQRTPFGEIKFGFISACACYSYYTREVFHRKVFLLVMPLYVKIL